MKKTFIIAEAGSNHNRNFEQAIKLIDAANAAGADAVKFQTFSSETVYSKNTPDFAGYKNINKLIKDIELPREWQIDLKGYCDRKGIEFMSTPFDEKAVEELVNLGVKRLKIAGFEATDPRFVEMVASTKLPIIMSTGIGFKWSHWQLYIDIFDKYGNDVTLLHCNNAYPTPPEDVFLDTIKRISSKTNFRTGFSDHTMSPYTPALAVAAGATVIEKHFTLDRSLPGPDHPFSLEPDELKIMVEQIRYAEKCKGEKSGLSTSEDRFKTAMRSIVAKTHIKKGEILTAENITTKRPFLEGNIPALNWATTLGRVADRDYDIDSFIK
tara:strand:- start:16203 stop:17177 length:975 start_codon:yes stop_codon:yes gene_type:complete